MKKIIKNIIIAVLLFLLFALPSDAQILQGIMSGGTTWSGVKASGGTITYDGDYKIHTFTGSGDFTVTQAGNVRVLVVAGGGGSGPSSEEDNTGSGGGGAGGSVESGTLPVTVKVYSITIGAGGAADYNGNDSIALGLTAFGGGCGTGYIGIDGGCGGGGGWAYPGGWGSQGGHGGNSNGGSGRGGGGGGMGAAGARGDDSGNGGIGLASNISGSSVYYCGGGGAGSSYPLPGSGGSGGGGNGGKDANGGAGAVNTGGGGGGTGGNWPRSGGAGGSGIVIIRYLYQ